MQKLILILLFIIFSNLAHADHNLELGKEVYINKAQCGTCHTLKAAKSEGNIGPNLDQLRPQVEQIISAVTNGIGVMPPWGGVLTPEEIEAVAHYVFNSTNN